MQSLVTACVFVAVLCLVGILSADKVFGSRHAAIGAWRSLGQSGDAIVLDIRADRLDCEMPGSRFTLVRHALVLGPIKVPRPAYDVVSRSMVKFNLPGNGLSGSTLALKDGGRASLTLSNGKIYDLARSQ